MIVTQCTRYSYVAIWITIAEPAMANRGPQKSAIELAELTWQTSPNRKDTPVMVIVIVKKVAATDQPKPCAQ